MLAQRCVLVTKSRLPSRLTLNTSGLVPSQLVIFTGLPEGIPLSGSMTIDHRFSPMIATFSDMEKMRRPFRNQTPLSESNESERASFGLPPSTDTVSRLPPIPRVGFFI